MYKLLQFWGRLLCVFSLVCSLEASDVASDVGKTPDEMIKNNGYVGEVHYITTEDGYVLTTNRIPHGKNDTHGKRPAVLVVHGLLSSSADSVNMGSEKSLSFILADRGYDVWIPNARGNTFSKNHTSLSPTHDAKKFYDFSWHEIGYYDLAATIDYILKTNGDESLYLVAHAQGTTAYVVLTSTRPEYNKKIKVAHLMAPLVLWDNHRSKIFILLAKNLKAILSFLERVHVYQVPLLNEVRTVTTFICGFKPFQKLCADYISILGGGPPDKDQFPYDRLPVITSNTPADGSLKQLIHYLQQIINGGFRQFDYGAAKNLLRYKAPTPPSYDISKITTPTAIYYGQADKVSVPADVEALINKLPNIAEKYLVPYEKFNNLDFVLGKDAVTLVYEEIIAVNKKHP